MDFYHMKIIRKVLRDESNEEDCYEGLGPQAGTFRWEDFVW